MRVRPRLADTLKGNKVRTILIVMKSLSISLTFVVLARRFAESYHAGILTIRVFRRSPHSNPPTEDQIGVCQARFDGDDTETEACDPQFDHDHTDHNPDLDMPELVYPAPISVYDRDNRQPSSAARLPPPFSPAHASFDEPMGDFPNSAATTTDTPDFMSPSAGVFHAHTLDLPLEAPPPTARRPSPPTVPAFPSFPTVNLAPPPMRAFYPRNAAPNPDPSTSTRSPARTHVPPPARRGLGPGWADEARRTAAARIEPDRHWSGGGLIADESLVHMAQEVFRAQAHEGGEAEEESDMPELEVVVAVGRRGSVERREDLRSQESQAGDGADRSGMEWRRRFGAEAEVESEEA